MFQFVEHDFSKLIFQKSSRDQQGVSMVKVIYVKLFHCALSMMSVLVRERSFVRQLRRQLGLLTKTHQKLDYEKVEFD